jgi:hypothetical protein
VIICHIALPVNEDTTVVDYRYQSTSESLNTLKNGPSRIRISSEDANNYSIPPACLD